MPGPNGEICKNCQCYEKSTQIGQGTCHANAPAPTLIAIKKGIPIVFVMPTKNESDWCINDYKPLKPKETIN